MRLIDADVLLETGAGIKMIIPVNCHPYEAIRIQGNAFRKAVEESPTIDAVEVVRCRDCVHRELWRSGYRCKLNADPYAGPVVDGGSDEFCSYGERRTDETN